MPCVRDVPGLRLIEDDWPESADRSRCVSPDIPLVAPVPVRPRPGVSLSHLNGMVSISTPPAVVASGQYGSWSIWPMVKTPVVSIPSSPLLGWVGTVGDGSGISLVLAVSGILSVCRRTLIINTSRKIDYRSRLSLSSVFEVILMRLDHVLSVS